MSIQPGRVLWRIVDEVDRAPRAALARRVFSGAALCNAARGERVEVARVAASEASGAAPFATLLHFWTHALRGWLDTLGQVDQLVGAAGYAMCEGMDEAQTRGELEQLAQLLVGEADALDLRGNFAEAYRMIDGSCRKSFVVASDVEWLSLTWAHGLATDAVLPTRASAVGSWQLHSRA